MKDTAASPIGRPQVETTSTQNDCLKRGWFAADNIRVVREPAGC
jgi:hypothetical protein